MSFTAPPSNPFLTEEEQAVTKSTVAAIIRSGQFRLESDGSTYTLPPYAVQKIVNLLDLMADGQDIEIIPAQSELPVPLAAKFLDMSEACIDELLDNGVIEYRQDGGHRLIKRDSLLEYESEYRGRREAVVEIGRMSREMGLYD